MSSSSTSPKKVILHADNNFIKHLYAEHDKDYHHKQQRSSSSSSFSGPNTKSHKKKCEIIHRRVTKFYSFFDPMMNFLLMNRYAMYNKQNKIDVETMPVDYIMVVHLIDCPSESGRPQLRIDKLEPRQMADLNEEERAALQHDVVSSKETDEEFLLPHLVSYRTHEGYIWTSIRTNSYDFNPLIIGRVSQKALMGRIIAFAQGINEIAKGERQDLYDMIKRQMKEARRSKVVELPLRSVGGRERGVVVGSAMSHHRLNNDTESDKENVEHNENTISKDDNDDVESTTLKERNATSKGPNHENEKTARKYEQ